MKDKATPSFRQFHLKILRSLYTDDAKDSSTTENHETDTNKETDTKSEPPIPPKTWTLIQKFLTERTQYHPLKHRQTHWTRLNTESSCRLNHLLESEAREKKKLRREKRGTPCRTPSLLGKRPLTPVSLTPSSSNGVKSTEKHELSCWNFINAMVSKRATSCTSSCEAFRSQPLFAELYKECEVRCGILNGRLEELRVRSPGEELGSKRQKVYFFRDYHLEDVGDAEASENAEEKVDEVINETKIKLCLWSNLLESVKEIVDEK